MKLSSFFLMLILAVTVSSCGSDSSGPAASGERPREELQSQKFAGEWTGKGQFYDTYWGEVSYDADATITISFDADQVTFKDCWAFNSVNDGNVTSCAETKLKIVGSQLFYEDTLYGTISADQINVKLNTSDYSVKAEIKLTSAGLMDYIFSSKGLDNDGKSFTSYQEARGLKK